MWWALGKEGGGRAAQFEPVRQAEGRHPRSDRAPGTLRAP